MKTTITALSLSSLLVVLTGCIGYDRALLVTKTNVGLDIDSTPPTAELTIARREIGIQPTFPDRPKPTITKIESSNNGKHSETQTALPLLASFGLEGNFINPSITAYFAGGDAAVSLARENNNDENEDNAFVEEESSLCLINEPEDIRSPLKKFWHFLIGKSKEEAEAEPRPFYFSTDTTYGLKVAWTGTGGPYPDNLKLGYNRKEMASAPLFVYQGCDGSKKFGNWQVKLPSFMATIDNASSLEMFEKSGTKHVQFFATGRAATELAKRRSVQKAAIKLMAPEAAALEKQ